MSSQSKSSPTSIAYMVLVSKFQCSVLIQGWYSEAITLVLKYELSILG